MDSNMRGRKKLKEIAQEIRSGQEAGLVSDPPEATIRQLIGWFSYERRTKYCVSIVRNAIDSLDLKTVPDFESPYIGATIRFELVPAGDQPADATEDLDDPAVRIGAFPAANNPPTIVRPDNPLCAATTLMLMHDFSQLPVISGERELKGVVSWKSIGSRLALRNECDLVKNCMDPPIEVSIDDHIFDAIRYISENDYVLVRDTDKKIKGIVTASDLVHQFQQLTGPFLIVGEIEGYLRKLAHRKFTEDELRSSAGDQGEGAQIEGLADLTLGNYIRLLGDKQNWHQLNLLIDRGKFIDQLDKIRTIRNDVMHFSPDGLDPADVDQLHDFARFFRNLDRMGSV